jgi:hypothetical protein
MLEETPKMAIWKSTTRSMMLALVVLFALPSLAQVQAQGPYGNQNDPDDPPTRVARLSYTSGSVSFQPAGTEDWVDAMVNRPVGTGDSLWADQGARAALHIGSASIVLGENTGFSFLNLGDNVTQIQLQSGTLRVRVKRLNDQENFEIDTPNLAYNILRPGIYKITVSPDGQTTGIEDRAGEGEVDGGGSSFTTHAGEFDTFYGQDQLQASTDSIYDNDDELEQWSERRDHHEDNSPSMRYVSDDVIGYDDLDDYGGWRDTPDYGTVWFPHTTQVGWAPYHYGHWAYIAPWGYTWVDDAPWGFAPFHYGRWVNYNGAWGWVPAPPRPVGYVSGPAYVRPVYAPALVAWVGGVGGGAGVAWFALGPREVYVPSYPVSRGYVERVNVSNTRVETTVVNNYYNTVVVNKTVTNVVYVNQRVPGAVVATSSQTFTTGRPIQRDVVHFDERAVSTAQVQVHAPAAVPQREAVLGGRPAANVRPPAVIQARAVVAKTPPPPPPPSFAARQTAIQANGGRPLSVAQARQIVPAAAPAHAGAAPAAGAVFARPVKVEAPKPNAAPMRVAPATPQQHAANPTFKPGAQPVQPAANPNANRPPQQAPNANDNRAPAVNANDNRPAAPTPNTSRPPAPAPNQPALANTNANFNRAPTAHPLNDDVEQRHQQQQADLHKQQDQERQQLEQKQAQERQQAQQQAQQQTQREAAETRQQQLNQQHEQQMKEMQDKHQQEQQQLQKQQEQEHKQPESQKKQPPPPPATQPK